MSVPTVLSRLLYAVLIVAVSAVMGCGLLIDQTPPAETPVRSGLLKNNLPPDAVSFDILIVRVPYSERSLLDQLWNDVDEQDLDPQTRLKLSENGFRAGIIGATVPDSLSELMALKGRGLRQSVEDVLNPEETSDTPSQTLSKTETLRPGNKCIIKTLDEPVDRIPVLTSEMGVISGRNYENAETKLQVMIHSVPDGSVAFDVTPFLTFGEPQIVTTYKYSQMHRAVDQPTKTFEELCCSLPLRPGQFLVIGPSNVKTTGLGHYFFAHGSGDYEQQIVVIRLLFTQQDERFYHFPGFEEILEKKMEEEAVISSKTLEE